MGCGDFIEDSLKWGADPLGMALGIQGPGSVLTGQFWNFEADIKSDWKKIKHLLVADMRRDREQMVNAADTPRRIIYGRVRSAGQLVYACSAGALKENLSMMITYAGHPIDSFDEIYLDDQLITESQFAGAVTHITYDGTHTTASAEMIADSGGLWTADHKGLGCANLYIKFTYSDSAFPGGLPTPKPVIKGRKVYDPRTGTTAWSDNPALCALDYMIMAEIIGGMGCEMSTAFWAAVAAGQPYTTTTGNDEINIESIIEAADYCDEMVATPNTTHALYDSSRAYLTNNIVIASDGLVYMAKQDVPANNDPILANKNFTATADLVDTYWLNVPDTETEKRYTCNGTLDINGTPGALLTPILDCMDAEPVYSEGTWKIFIGKPYTGEIVTIDESWLNGGIQFRCGNNKNGLANTGKGTFINPLDHWATTDFPIIAIDDYIAEDREELTVDMQLPFTDSPYMAQRLTRLKIERSRRGNTMAYPCKLKAVKLAPNMVIKLNNRRLGRTEQLNRVTDWSFSPMGGINLNLRYEDPSIYTINPFDLKALPQPALTNLPTPWSVPAPVMDVPTESLYNAVNVIKCRVSVTWTQPSVGISRFDVEYSTNGGTTWIPSSPTSDTKATFEDAQPGAVKYRVRAVNVFGVQSAWSIVNYIILGDTTALANVTGLVNYYSGIYTRLKWQAITDIRPFVYEVRFGAAFATAMILGTTTTTEFSATANGTYWVTAKYLNNGSALYSATPASLTISGSVLVKNVVQTWDEFATGWSGTLSGGAEIDVANRIWLKNTAGVVSSSGTYTIPAGHIVDLGTVQTCNITAQYTALSDSPVNMFDSIANLDAVADLDGNYAGFSNVQIQIQIHNGTSWGAWQDFIAGPYVGQKFNMRASLTSASTSVTAVLSAFSFTVDMDDKFDLQTNIAIAAGGTAIAYAKPFQIAPNVQVTILNSVAGDKIGFLAGPAATGLTLQITNGGTGVARNCNIFSQAY